MELKDLVVGQEYYTARDDIWATGQMGGRVRVVSLDAEDLNYDPDEAPDLYVPCERLDPKTGAVLKSYSMTRLTGFRGLWDPVGVAAMADLDRAERERQATEAADLAGAEAARDALMRLGIPSVIRNVNGAQLVALTPAQVMRLIEHGGSGR